jgi:hypothetical protein
MKRAENSALFVLLLVPRTDRLLRDLLFSDFLERLAVDAQRRGGPRLKPAQPDLDPAALK